MAGEIGHYCGIDFIGGGIGAVDKIDGAVLQDKDAFLVVTPTVFAPLSLDADSGAGESSPQIIAPNTNPGDKRWILTGGVFANLTLYGNITMPDGGTIGRADGPLIEFSNTEDNELVISGCQVGIGVAVGAVGAALHIVNTTFAQLRLHNEDIENLAAEAGIRFRSLGSDASAHADMGFTATGADQGDLVFRNPHNAERFRIRSNGKIGVNEPDPASNFDVNGDINTTVNYKVDDTQVVSNQGAVVADATDPASTMARLNDLLARCRAHGLIAT